MIEFIESQRAIENNLSSIFGATGGENNAPNSRASKEMKSMEFTKETEMKSEETNSSFDKYFEEEK